MYDRYFNTYYTEHRYVYLLIKAYIGTNYKKVLGSH